MRSDWLFRVEIWELLIQLHLLNHLEISCLKLLEPVSIRSHQNLIYVTSQCIMDRIRNESETCPICGKDTSAVFNQPTKLIKKKKKLLGMEASKAQNSWEEYANAFASSKGHEE